MSREPTSFAHQLRCAARGSARLLVVALLLTLPGRVLGATDDTVNDTRDLLDPSPNIGPCESTGGTCTLRAAIMRANARSTGTHTIRLPKGTFKLTRAGRDEDDAKTGDLDIKEKVVIIGAGAKSTIIDAAGLDRAFDVRRGSLVLQGVSVINGRALGEVDGGGIRAKRPLTLNRVEVRANEAGGKGGGVFAEAALSIVRSTIAGNSAGRGAGGVDADAPSSAVNVLSVPVSIRGSTISGNDGATSGGIGILGFNDLTLEFSTIAFNSTSIPTSTHGAGLVYLPTVPITTPRAMTRLLVNSVILAHNARLGADNSNCDLDTFTPVADLVFNVEAGATCGMSTNDFNLVDVDPRLAPLADNGGQTPTHVFGELSLVNKGDFFSSVCTGTDQRGLPRPALGGCDPGAVELQSTAGVAVLDPEEGNARSDERYDLRYLWRVPEPGRWRDLESLDLQIVGDGETLFWVRWEEESDTLQAIGPDGEPTGPALPIGTGGELATREVSLDVGQSSRTVAGPDSPEVTLDLPLAFSGRRTGRLAIEVTARGDDGSGGPLFPAGAIVVDSAQPRDRVYPRIGGTRVPLLRR